MEASPIKQGNRGILKELHENKTVKSPSAPKPTVDGVDNGNADASTDKINSTAAAAASSSPPLTSNAFDNIKNLRFSTNENFFQFQEEKNIATEAFNDPLKHTAATEQSPQESKEKIKEKPSDTKFVGLSKFDESKIPDLPSSLSPNLEAQLKCTFADKFIPFHNVESQVLDLKTPKTGIDNSRKDLPSLSTSPSSNSGSNTDNDHFTDCSSFRDGGQIDQDNTTSYQTVTKIEEQLDEAIAKITKICTTPQLSPRNALYLEGTFENDGDEPMDIDLSFSDYLQLPQEHLERNSKLNLQLENFNEPESKVREMPLGASDSRQRLTFSMTEKCFETKTSPISDVAGYVDQFNNNSDVAGEIKILESLTKSNLEAHAGSDNTMSSSLSKADTRSTLTLDMTNSFCSAKSSASNSPTFPMKSNLGKKQFPISPKAIKDRQMPFLEESAYTERIRKISMDAQPFTDGKVTETPPPRKISLPEKLSPTSATISTNHEPLNSTFDEKTSPDSLPTLSSATGGLEDREKRRTFNIPFVSNEKSLPSNVNEDKEFALPNAVDLYLEKDKQRRTFNIEPLPETNNRRTFNVQKGNASNSTCEPMDLDETMPSSPQKIETATQEIICQSANQNDAGISPQQRAISPPLPAVQRRLSGGDSKSINQNMQTSSTSLPSGISPNYQNTVGDGDFKSSSLPTNSSFRSPEFISRRTFNLDDDNKRSNSPPVPAVLRRLSLEDPDIVFVTKSSPSKPTTPTMSPSPNRRSSSPPVPAVQRRLSLEEAALSLSPEIGLPKRQSTEISSGSVTPLSLSVEKQLNTEEQLPKSRSSLSLPLGVGSNANSGETSPLPESQPSSSSSTRRQQLSCKNNSNEQLCPPTEPVRPISPPVPAVQKRLSLEMKETAIPTDIIDEAKEQMPPPPLPPPRRSHSPSNAAQLKRPPIHRKEPTSDPEFSDLPTDIAEMITAKECLQSKRKDEKDLANNKLTPRIAYDTISKTSELPFDELYSDPSTSSFENDFKNHFVLNPSDFDFLLTRGSNTNQVDRSSLLLRFDPLLGQPVPVNQSAQQQQQQLQPQSSTTSLFFNCAIDESEENEEITESASNENVTATYGIPLKEDRNVLSNEETIILSTDTKSEVKSKAPKEEIQQQKLVTAKKNASMSVDVIKDMNSENECIKTFENSNSQSDAKDNYRMDELEKKIRNEVLKTEDIEKKLTEAEQREEALIKRITEKDKTISKMNGVIEAYEKAIAELIAEKEVIVQKYEKELAEARADRDSNYHHLTSLETTFSDLHVKYEKSKEMTEQLKTSEEALLADKRQYLENIRLQEQRYEKMKSYAMTQLEVANSRLETITKEHAIETTKLKALLKKEEISRASINEQLQQKTKENTELVKICDELINGNGS